MRRSWQLSGTSVLESEKKNILNKTIPLQLGNLVSLQILLEVGHNSTTVEISPQLGKLTKLEVLILSLNQLSGNKTFQPSRSYKPLVILSPWWLGI